MTGAELKLELIKIQKLTGDSITTISEKMGYRQSHLSSVANLRNQKQVSDEMIARLRLAYPVDDEPSILMDEPEPYVAMRRKLKNSDKDDLPVYIGNTQAGKIEVYSDDPGAQTPVAFLPAQIFPGCNHAERVTGNSMYPRIVNQGYVVGKVVDKRQTLAPGEIYGVHFNGMAVVKYLHIQSDGHFLLKSDNKEVPSFTVPMDEVTFLFRVYFILNPA